jgi:hypothetical protein
MVESIAELLDRLRFVSRPVEALYLNEDRVHDNFIGQLGAIESFTRTAAKEGSLEAPVIKIGTRISSESGVSWSLSDPLAQVLVLQSALESQKLVDEIHAARPGHYVAFTGVGSVSRPGMFDDAHRERLRNHTLLYKGLEAERAKQESAARIIHDSKNSRWLLTVSEGISVCAATLDSRWLRPAFNHWLDPDYAVAPWEIFGLCRRIHETGVPMIAALYVGVKW